MVGDLRMWLGRIQTRQPTQMRRPPAILTEHPDHPAAPSCLATLRAAGLVEGRRDPNDHRARVYDIRREQLVQLAGWLDVLERNWRRRHVGPADPDYYKTETTKRLDPNRTTRGTPRKRIPRTLKEPWEH